MTTHEFAKQLLKSKELTMLCKDSEYDCYDEVNPRVEDLKEVTWRQNVKGRIYEILPPEVTAYYNKEQFMRLKRDINTIILAHKDVKVLVIYPE